jgi:hypothetical protein
MDSEEGRVGRNLLCHTGICLKERNRENPSGYTVQEPFKYGPNTLVVC